MTAKHTPGPWHRNIAPASKYTVVFAGRNTHVAQVTPQGHSEETCEANINLIAAAPELLAELERMYEAARCMADPEHCLHNSREYLPWRALADQAKAAIAKAEGR